MALARTGKDAKHYANQGGDWPRERAHYFSLPTQTGHLAN